MKTINIKHYLVAAALCCGVATALTACAEWDDHYDGGASTGSDLTLWQQLQGRQELSEFCKLLEQTNIERILCNGALSKKVYDKYQLERTGIPALKMPSTSPANAAWSLERLVEEWRKVL